MKYQNIKKQLLKLPADFYEKRVDFYKHTGIYSEKSAVFHCFSCISFEHKGVILVYQKERLLDSLDN